MATKNGSNHKRTLHIAMFPWLGFGHIIPFLELCKLIAQKGHKISFISTPRNIDRLPKIPPHLAPSIDLVKIPLPKIADLPQNAEATIDIQHEQMDHLKKAYDGLEPGLTRFLEQSDPDWIIYDFAPHWLPPIATRLGISRAFFLISNAWFLAFFGSGSDYRTRPEDFMVPPKWVKFETKVAYRRYEAKWVVGSGQNHDSGVSDADRSGRVIAGCEAIIVRHCREFEPEWLILLEELHRKPVIPLGLMPPKLDQDFQDPDLENGNDWVTIKNWLDEKGNGSVLYVAFGSEVRPSQEQLSELAHGLELSGVDFFWVMKKSTGSDSVGVPEGFEERVRGRGVVWRGWVPQVRILSHDSVGGFLSHCGWSSIVEGVMCGCPLIALPFLVDQGLNARVVVEKGLGVEIGRDEENGTYSRDSVADSVRFVMVGKDGEKLRESAREMGAMFGDGELHSGYIDEFVKFLENHRIEVVNE